MEGQGNILKIVLIAAVVYTLALGAPVKRDTSSSNVTEICAAAKRVRTLTMCPSETTTKWPLPVAFVPGSHYEESSTAEPLSRKLQEHNFSGMVCVAVRKCLNSSDPDPQKCLNSSNPDPQECEVAAAAIRLQDTIRRFVFKHGETWVQNDCNDCIPPAVEVDIKQTLCNATTYILDVLDDIKVEGGQPFTMDCSI